MNGINLSTATDIRLGGTSVSAVYFGSTKLWPSGPHDYSQDYLTIESLTDNNNIVWTQVGSWSSTQAKEIYWSTNKVNWTSAKITSGSSISLSTLNTGGKIYLKGSNNSYGSTSTIYHKIDASGNFKVYGNIMSMLYGDNFINQTSLNGYAGTFIGFFRSGYLVNAENLILPATILTTDCYNSMFSGCSALTTAPALPATTLAKKCYNHMFQKCTSLTTAPVLASTDIVNQCYAYMFYGCSALTTAPALPATYIDTQCYSYMFYGCSTLTMAPALPATTLAQGCYDSMFQNCTSLTAAPELLATYVGNRCYQHMFKGCPRLNYIKCLATNIGTSSATTGWVNGVASSGTFVKDASMSSWTTDVNGIPSGWTVQDAT